MLRRLLFTLGKLLFLFVLPFFLLIRGSVFLHENYALPAWGSMLGGVAMSATLLFFYIVYLQGRLSGRAGNVRRTYGLAFALVFVYCLPGLFYLSASNAKHEAVRLEFTRLHPVLRLGVSTLTFLDKNLIVTDAGRQPEDYGSMGLPANGHSLHYIQSSGYAHAVDLRTIRQGEIRNALVAGYFQLMGFNTLRHVGAADHLHVSLMCMDPKKEGNKYDKIIKENLERLFMPFLEQLLSIRIVSAENLPAKMQTTLEREADFVRKVLTQEGKEVILHVEFESVVEPAMVYRLSEYHGILLKKYQLPVHHVVVHLGELRPNIQVQLEPEEVFTGFELIDFGRLDFEELINSQIPEVVVLAILADFKRKLPEEAIRSIIGRLQQVAKGKLSLQKFIRQLNVLSGLRKLHELTVKTIEAMPVTYDIKKDFLYKKGKEEGIEKGMEKGLETGLEKGQELKERIFVTRGWEKGLAPEEFSLPLGEGRGGACRTGGYAPGTGESNYPGIGNGWERERLICSIVR